jgi:hypothetical protein
VEHMPLFPLSGAANRPTVNCNEIGPWVTYVSDQHGFNNMPAVWPEQADVLITGDSFMHGICVASDSTVAARLRRRWPNTISVGMGSNGPLIELGSVVEFGTRLRPRAVVWAYFEGNDLTDLNFEKQNPLLRRYLEPGFSQGLVDRQPSVDSAAQVLVNSAIARWQRGERPARRRPLRDLVDLWHVRERVGLVNEMPLDLALFSKILERARDQTASWGGKFFLLYLPSATVLAPGEPSQVLRDSVLAIGRHLDLTTIDLYPAFRRQDATKLFTGKWPYAGHYNDAGYDLVADLVADTLQLYLNR